MIVDESREVYVEITEKFWREIEQRAKKRNILFLIEKEEAWKIFLLQNKRCAITSIALDFKSNGYRGTASLDRINSHKPYVWHNLQWVLGDINIMKKDHNLCYFKRLCELVTNHNSEISLLR
jgi:hypothetical protein